MNKKMASRRINRKEEESNREPTTTNPATTGSKKLTKMIGNFKKLTRLNLSKTKLDSSDLETCEAFRQLDKLEELDLSFNRIGNLAKDIFENFKHLSTLNLESNRLKTVDAELFSSQINLKRLDLSKNSFSSVCVRFPSNCQLEILDLSSNMIKEIDIDENLVHIKQLDLSDNSIEDLKLKFIKNHSRCLNLNFSFNYIQKFQLSLMNQPKDLRINLSSNSIRHIGDIKIAITTANESKIKIVMRYNLFQELSPNDLAAAVSSWEMDLRNNNNLDEESLDLISSFPNRIKTDLNHSTQTSTDVKEKNLISRMNFDLLPTKQTNRFVRYIDPCEGLSRFSILTGKNGVGKSTVLGYFKETISHYYTMIKSELDRRDWSSVEQQTITIWNEFKPFNDCINVFSEVNKTIESLFIPVVYKMYDTIRPDMVSFHEIKQLIDYFLTVTQRNEQDAATRTTTKDDWSNRKAFEVHSKVMEIFATKSIEDLILNFRSKEKLLNQHLQHFKYDVRILNEKDQDEEDRPRVNFVEKNVSEPTILESSTSLSPGEQLVIMFKLWEFSMNRYEIPHTPVLLLDEPDAHLHPEAVFDFVRILENLSQCGAQIIMSTHNPNTVSFVNESNLFCMKKYEVTGGYRVRIEKAKTKAEIFRELTPSLIMVNIPIRVVLVEGKAGSMPKHVPANEHRITGDALFYRNVLNELSKVNASYSHQIMFKSFCGDTNIQQFINLCVPQLYIDHFGIVDNDNLFWIPESNDRASLQAYFECRKQFFFNLIRCSFENYILDPVGLIVYLNVFSIRENSARPFKIDVSDENSSDSDKSNLSFINKKIRSVNGDNSLITSVDELKKKINAHVIMQSIIDTLAKKLFNYLTEFDGLNFRILAPGQSSFLNNLLPLFRFVEKKKRVTF